MKTTPPIVRFERKFIIAPSGHWIWTANMLPNGYGQMDKKYAHRLSHEFYIGPIPDGFVIDHLCRVRNCVNPQHLQAVTQKVNTSRGSASIAVKLSNARRGAERTHCLHGHEFTEENTWTETKRNGNKMRRCKICRKAQASLRSSASSHRSMWWRPDMHRTQDPS